MTSTAPTAPAPVDFLDEDPITVPGQLFALVSFVTPTANQKSDACAMKIRGVFGTRDEASAHVKRLMRIDNSFDVYLMDMYKWVPVPPDPNTVNDQEYTDRALNDLMKGYKESQLAAKQHFAERKRLVMEQGLDKVLTDEERIPAPDPDLPDVFDQPDPRPAPTGSDPGPSA